jgi:hypothetical protein
MCSRMFFRYDDSVEGLSRCPRYSCGCRSTREEFHDGSVHRMVVHHSGKVLADEEWRGE